MEDSPHPKYYLSKTACLGILRRAKEKGKELPAQLKVALEIQADLVSETEKMLDMPELKSYHINQRNEGIDLKNISGALMATQNMQMQTFIKEPLTQKEKMGTKILSNKQAVLFDNHGKDCRYNGPLKVAPTIASVYGTGGNNIPLIKQPLENSIYSNDNKFINMITLDKSNIVTDKNQGKVDILQPQESYCIAANTIDRQPFNGGNGQGVQKNISYTLTTSDIHAIYKPEPYQEIVGSLCRGDAKGIGNQYVSQGKCVIGDSLESSYDRRCINSKEKISTSKNIWENNGCRSENKPIKKNIVRRLTPLECERLQGFPDGWTSIEKVADSPRYKALGNSVAIPCVDFIMRGIAFFLQQIKKEEEYNEIPISR